MSSSLLVLYLLLSSGLPRPTGAVVLANAGSTDVRVWNMGNSWGDITLSFEVLRDGLVSHVVRKDQEYTRNVASSFVLPAGARHEWTFDMGDGDWEAERRLDDVFGANAKLTAIYEILPSSEASRQEVWIGRIRSEPVMLLETP